MAKHHKWGASSIAALEGVDERMVRVATRALEICPLDLRVLEGVRTRKRQADLYAQGRTKPGKIVTWTLNSRHFPDPRTGKGRAIDIVPLPVDWNNLAAFDAMARAFFQASQELGIPIRWGANWDGDGRWREKGETDSPHFELSPTVM